MIWVATYLISILWAITLLYYSSELVKTFILRITKFMSFTLNLHSIIFKLALKWRALVVWVPIHFQVIDVIRFIYFDPLKLVLRLVVSLDRILMHLDIVLIWLLLGTNVPTIAYIFIIIPECKLRRLNFTSSVVDYLIDFLKLRTIAWHVV